MPASTGFPPLESLGPRICVCGPSNAGKSTLTVAIATKLGVPALHLDQMRHLPRTDWVQRPDAEFRALHDEAVMGESWVMDGNYSRLSPLRWQRATGIILLGTDRWTAFYRYLRRTLFERERAGQLDGALDSVKWEMIRWILIVQPTRRDEYAALLRKTGLPMLQLRSFGDVMHLYEQWGLTRP